ncbi:multicomponent Na+:H+ antiporter subunit F [Corynebacterium appendicis CIP 107643]|uniref:Multicomponent Na+:H+ antiporter subunit F n=1 Tax=Corynebacterium appendicis CIP 107643 TaxID=1161099 RepID=A0A1N7J7G7_9CORY|nr:monovalent cation/H+ antiporter complex subunit F [Corynebacterium appendicis]MCT1684064.1 monovalent cation/H+ antiporter complex subunit F [Corynebacterium appendicis]WJY61890.1 putative monovalent cation/H+ antiporter subunit F [Corynebacterium appendicis CIP 107643]SIS45244.1 multicomponent Na+:H+ antiporter subunit F [Corynebacterium appendicis CIP 107643]
MDDAIYNSVLAVAAVLLVVGFFITTWRLVIGPNSLDRAIAMDGIVASIQCALATYICWTLDTTVVNAMVVVALLGFIGSLSVARFRKRDGAV